ncbi:MAG: phosphotransferase [Parvibaculum sp.]|nr:phosphotransferase [Parvibaculum sp.]
MFDPATLDALYKDIAPASADLPAPAHWVLAGEGLWGSVYDLSDGTMLKVVRRHGGLGNGETLHHREVQALTLLNGLTTDYVRVPKLVGAAPFTNSYLGSAPPLAGWVRMEGLQGRRLSTDSVLSSPARSRDLLGERIGAAIADFNLAATRLAEAAGSKLADTITRSLILARNQLGSAEMHRACDAIAKAWLDLCAQGPLVFVHGDLNPSNIIDNGADQPLGLVDFAESGWSLAETEFRHFEPLGAMRDSAFRGYTARSGNPPDLKAYYLASAADALMVIALRGNAGHPRDQMRRTGLLRHCLHEAGLTETMSEP